MLCPYHVFAINSKEKQNKQSIHLKIRYEDQLGPSHYLSIIQAKQFIK